MTEIFDGRRASLGRYARRPSWDDTWMRMARLMAQRSRCDKAQVGAVVVTEDNQVAAASYNGPPAGMRGLLYGCQHWCPRGSGTGINPDPEYLNCHSLHAEANAISRSDWTTIQGGTIYVSASVCLNCARLVASTGISRLVHRVVDDRDLNRDPDATEALLVDCGMEVSRVTDPDRWLI